MKKERLKVLNLLEQGKISAEEAAKLLETLKSPGFEPYYWDCDTAEEHINNFSKNFDGFVKDFGEKMDTAYKSVEPKLKKATFVVVEKTASIIDDIAKSLNDTLQSMEGDCCCNKQNSQSCCDDECCDDDCCDDECCDEDCCCGEQSADECCDDKPKEN